MSAPSGQAAHALVVPDHDSEGFWDLAEQGGDGFVVQVCPESGNRQYPPLPRCRRTGSTHLEWRREPTSGQIISWVRVVHPIYPHLVEAVPYTVVLVDVAPDCKVLARWTSSAAPRFKAKAHLGLRRSEGGWIAIAEPDAEGDE